MLILIGICAILPVFVLISKSLSRRRKHALILMEMSAALLLLADRYSYIYNGDTSMLGIGMTRTCNFLVYSFLLVLIYAFELYLIDLYKNEGQAEVIPKFLRVSKIIILFGEIMIIISQFTGIYYTFDDSNHYQRSSLYVISYINVPQGDIPNVQIDGWRKAATGGIPVHDGMKITFHTMSLPTARLIWHCPFIDLFYSDNRKIAGENYREFALIRLDGESWEADEKAENKMRYSLTDEFKGWDDWKERNKQGLECTVTFEKDGDTIIVTGELGGVVTRSTTTINDDVNIVYAALTGDQCALTNIRIQ